MNTFCDFMDINHYCASDTISEDKIRQNKTGAFDKAPVFLISKIVFVFTPSIAG